MFRLHTLLHNDFIHGFAVIFFASVNEPVPATAGARLNEQVHRLAITFVSISTSPVVNIVLTRLLFLLDMGFIDKRGKFGYYICV